MWVSDEKKYIYIQGRGHSKFPHKNSIKLDFEVILSFLLEFTWQVLCFTVADSGDGKDKIQSRSHWKALLECKM